MSLHSYGQLKDREIEEATRKRRSLVILTPLVDIVFILLIFFMLVSSFLDWRSVQLKLPAKANAGATDDAALVVSVIENGTLKLNGQPIADVDFVVRLGERLLNDAEHPILIHAAEGVPLQRSIEVLEEITVAGGRNVSLSRNRRAAP